ncbi:MAG: hypothetical protein K2K21_16180 [Lachnospiraceae bacterium]|nr:hypothetical protein [Lachnospiraceae bacterium]
MKFVKRISLFFIMAGMMFGAGSYVTYRAEQFFYPKRYEQQNEKKPSIEVEENSGGRPADSARADEDVKEERIIEAAVENAPVITADTVYMVEEVNLSDGTITEKEEEIPVKYIGLDRDNLIEALKLYEQNPPLADLKQGFETIELSAFSKDRVVICKYYRREKENSGYYLMVANHYVIVYEEDKETVHMNTDILLESLSDELQKEIMEGKYMENEQALYNFLESYSS